MIEGYIVNKFRGDPTLFDGGLAHIGALTGWRSLGLVPYFDDAARLPAEDALALDAPRLAKPSAKARIAVLAYPRISNFDDFDPLRLEPSIELLFLRPGTPIPADCDLVILPGSKATIADLDALRACGWDIDLRAHVRRGGRVLGICGGYQMLGRNVSDPDGMEGRPGAREGLGLLDVKTHLTSEKLLVDVSGRSVPADIPFTGYEMHVGRTAGPDCARPLLKLSDGRSDGACSVDGRVTGCHVHGLFSDDRQRSFWMQQINAGHASVAYEADVDATLDALAKHLEKHIDIELLLSIARPPRFKS
jgi:adenosylcobyric acid synthase